MKCGDRQNWIGDSHRYRQYTPKINQLKDNNIYMYSQEDVPQYNVSMHENLTLENIYYKKCNDGDGGKIPISQLFRKQ